MGFRSEDAAKACFIRRARAASAAFFWALFCWEARRETVGFAGVFFFLVVCASADGVGQTNAKIRESARKERRARYTRLVYCEKSPPMSDASLSARIRITSEVK